MESTREEGGGHGEGSVASSELARAFDALTIAALAAQLRARQAALDPVYEAGLPKAGPTSLVRAMRCCPGAPELSGMAPDPDELGVVGWSQVGGVAGAGRERHIVLPARARVQGGERCVLLMAIALWPAERPEDPPVLLWGVAADAESAFKGAQAMELIPKGRRPLESALSRRWTPAALDIYLHPARLERARLERARLEAATGPGAAGAGPARL